MIQAIVKKLSQFGRRKPSTTCDSQSNSDDPKFQRNASSASAASLIRVLEVSDLYSVLRKFIGAEYGCVLRQLCSDVNQVVLDNSQDLHVFLCVSMWSSISIDTLATLLSQLDFLRVIRATFKFEKWVIDFSSERDYPMDAKAYASHLGRIHHQVKELLVLLDVMENIGVYLDEMREIDIPGFIDDIVDGISKEIQRIVDNIPNAHTLLGFEFFRNVDTRKSRSYYQGIKLETKFLNNCSSLRKLKLSYLNDLDLNFLNTCSFLLELDLSHTILPMDTGLLGKLTCLRKLDLTGSNISDLTVVGQLTTLEKLVLSRTEVSSATPLGSLTSLQKLFLTGTKVSDVSALQHLEKLEFLNIANTSVADISPLRKLTNLRTLSVEQTGVSNISALESLTSLEYLHIRRTAVVDISVLKNLVSLEAFSLSATREMDISCLVGLKSLRELLLGSSSVTDDVVLHQLESRGVHVSKGTPIFENLMS